MDMTVSKAKAHLTELVRRAEAGEEVVLTRNGHPVARLVAEKPKRVRTREEKLAILRDIQRRAKMHMTPGPEAARSQDFLYDDDGLPI
jgi:prevent-host-death family protein